MEKSAGGQALSKMSEMSTEDEIANFRGKTSEAHLLNTSRVAAPSDIMADDGVSQISIMRQLLGGLLNPHNSTNISRTSRSKSAKHASPGSLCLPDLLQEQAVAQPNAAAVRCNDEYLTFRELVDISQCIAMYLRHLGTAADSCVGVFVEPSIELMVGVWGILFSGCAYLPLSPEYPSERVRYMMEHARIKVVFCQEKLRQVASELAPSATSIITLKNVTAFVKSDAATIQCMHAPIDIRSYNLAYIIYTSGSTGKPKGVMIEHRSIVSQMQWMKETFALDQSKTVLQKTPMSFDAAQWEILAPACGTMVIMGHAGIYRDVKGLIDTIVHNGVTTLQCVPTLLQALLDTEEICDCRSLTQIFSGGEALAKRLAQQCLKKLPSCDLINLYGPTECTINASAFVVDRETVADGPNSVSIGRPANKMQFCVLDSNRNFLSEGEVGELYIGGIQVARGYLHQPDLTAERFTDDVFGSRSSDARFYRTGDLVRRNADGTYQFVGRIDNQVKLRGFRIELDEVRLAIERHDWVKNAAVLAQKDANTNMPHLTAYIELSPKEAALMDQGNHGSHHQSKASRFQVKAQLANAGCRDISSIRGKTTIDLPYKAPSSEQRALVFARKTYRFYDGGPVSKADIEQLLMSVQHGNTLLTPPRNPDTLTFDQFGEILRYFGQFISDERLLPKYGYASPGALYATQMYFEVGGADHLMPGYYYYHPVQHQLILINRDINATFGHIKIHFVGKRRAIEPVYKNNIREVLEIETGHMLGLFDAVLPAYGLSIVSAEHTPDTIQRLQCHSDDYYLGSFELVRYVEQEWDSSLDLYVQAHPGKVENMAAGQYHYCNGRLVWISDDIVQKNHVIAINQCVHERASFGVTLVSNTEGCLSYISLGRKLQHFQMNHLHFGFMSSGYSSKSGNNLPAANRVDDILEKCGLKAGPCYFFLGGRVSDEQWRSEGMKEDAVHMKGPAEMIKEDLTTMLPEYMVPKWVIVMDKLPLAANGKIDTNSLKAMKQPIPLSSERPFVASRTSTEERISRIWQKAMKLESVSITDDFFECGGNSLVAVSLVHQINAEFNETLPLQTIFKAPTIEKLGQLIANGCDCDSSRLIPLHQENGTGRRPVYCWPGLGGYPMNLRLLAGRLDRIRSFYGVQAHGINAGEQPYGTIQEMAAKDIEQIKCIQPHGPYTLWGYSFGARVAFEAAYQLEQAGDALDHIFLIAPGSPKVEGVDESTRDCTATPTFDNHHFVAMLFSVFAGCVNGQALDECLSCSKDEMSFVSFISRRYQDLQPELVKRIVQVVRQTYEFKYTFSELATRCLKAPVTIFKARGDDYSFVDEWARSACTCTTPTPTVIDTQADHYSLLKSAGVDELIRLIHERLGVVLENVAQRL